VSERDATPLVSVVLCTCDAGPFLREQLDSILGQSHRALQVIAIDDGSRDATAEHLARVAARDARLEVIPQRERRGQLPRLEEGLARVRGDFVLPADQDDVWEAEKIATLLAGLGGNDAIYSASALIDEQGRTLDSTLLEAIGVPAPVAGRDPWALFWHNTVSGHATLFRAALLAELLPFERDLMYDHQIGALAAARGGLAYCDRPLVRHRVHAGNQVTRLPRPASAPRDRARWEERRIQRRWETRKTLAAHAAYFARAKLDARFTERDAARLERTLDTFRQRSFDFSLFVSLVRQRRRLLRDRTGPLRWAWTTSRCEGWYDGSRGRRWRMPARSGTEV
jgi:glycosyltransferase involved in cell wall biosynthesis